MRIDDRLGVFSDLLTASPQHTETLLAIRALVASLHPDAHETASAKESSVWWGWGARKNTDGYAWAMPHASHVNFGFMQGASLPDPAQLLEGTGQSMRHIKIKSADRLGDPAIRALLAAARDERAATLKQE